MRSLIVAFILLGLPITLVLGQADSIIVERKISKATDFSKAGIYDSARKYYDEALPMLKQNKQLARYFEIRKELAKLWLRQNNPDSSLVNFKEIEREISDNNYFDYYLSYEVFYYQGYIHSLKNENQASIDAFKKGLVLTKEKDPRIRDKINLARLYNNIASTYSDGFNLELATSYYDSAILILRKEVDVPTELEHVIFLNKGKLLKDFGFFDEALESFTFSLRLLDKVDPQDISHIDRALAHLYMGLFYNHRNESRLDNLLAIKYGDSSRLFFKKANPNSFYLNYTDYLLGEANNNLGRHSEAKIFFDDAIKRTQSIYGSSYEELGYSFSMLGRTFDKLGLADSAEYYLTKAVDFYQTIEWESSDEVAEAHVRLAQFLMKSGKCQNALQIIQESLKVLIPAYAPGSLTDNPENEMLFNSGSLFWALQSKAEILESCFEKEGDVDKLIAAVDTYDKLINHINLSRRGLFSIKSKNKFFNRKYDVFEKGITVALKANKITEDQAFLEKAFLFSEASKANGLSDRLADKRINFRIPAELLEKENDLISRINFLEKELYSRKKDHSAEELKNQIFLLKTELQKLMLQLKQGFPEYHNTRQNAELNTELLRKKLDGRINLLEYFVGKDSTYVFHVSDKLSVGVIDNLELNQIEELINGLSNQLYNPDLAFGLFKTLIENHVDFDVNNRSITNFIIIPDGIINTLPFEMLLTKIPLSKNTAELEYLLKKAVVGYHYSANLLIQNSSEYQRRKGKLFTYAPDFSNGKQNLLATRSSNDSLLAKSMMELPFAKIEANTVASLMNGIARVDFDATEAKFRMDAKSANILHVASHAVLDNVNPLYSKLVFDNDGSTDDDGMLHAYELYNMSINAELICLSACNTGLGKYYKGEGVMSLAHGFMYSGVPNIMMSLWSVPDRSTSQIMESFYTYLKEDYTKAEALRQAKLDYLMNADNNTASPYYWSGFVFVGNVQELDEERSSMIYLWVLSALVALTLIVLIYKKKKAKIAS